jgi:hypothetical protein
MKYLDQMSQYLILLLMVTLRAVTSLELDPSKLTIASTVIPKHCLDLSFADWAKDPKEWPYLISALFHCQNSTFYHMQFNEKLDPDHNVKATKALTEIAQSLLNQPNVSFTYNNDTLRPSWLALLYYIYTNDLKPTAETWIKILGTLESTKETDDCKGDACLLFIDTLLAIGLAQEGVRDCSALWSVLKDSEDTIVGENGMAGRSRTLYARGTHQQVPGKPSPPGSPRTLRSTFA